MKEQFVTYEIALAVKELGFNEPCLATYRGGSLYQFGSGGYYEDWNEHRSYGDMNQWVSAPLWQQVIDWLFNEHGLYLVITVNPYSEINLFNGYKIYSDNTEDLKCIVNQETQCWSYYKAREQSILKAIEIIKKYDTH